MRIVRVIVGVLLLTLGVPALVVGGAYWVAGPPPPDGGSALRVADPAVALVVLAVGALALAAGALALAAAHRPVVVVAEPADAAALAARLGVRLLESPPRRVASCCDAFRGEPVACSYTSVHCGTIHRRPGRCPPTGPRPWRTRRNRPRGERTRPLPRRRTNPCHRRRRSP